MGTAARTGLDGAMPNLATVAMSGAYGDLSGKPALFDGSWSSLTGKPTIFSGAYADLTGQPALFAGTWAALTGKPTLFSGAYADLTGKPVLFSGSYPDLANKPALFSGAYADLTGLPTLFSGTWAALTGKPTLFSGAYADLTGKPTIVNVQAARAQTDATGLLTWTFPTPFATGVLPIIGALVEDSTAGALFGLRITARTNTSVTIQLSKSAAVTVAGISVLGAAAGVQAYLHLTATAPT